MFQVTICFPGTFRPGQGRPGQGRPGQGRPAHNENLKNARARRPSRQPGTGQGYVADGSLLGYNRAFFGGSGRLPGKGPASAPVLP